MSVLTLRLPEWLHGAARKLAEEEGVSLNQLITLALAEKLSALETERFFAGRAGKGSRAAFEQAMARVPKVEPPEFDRFLLLQSLTEPVAH